MSEMFYRSVSNLTADYTGRTLDGLLVPLGVRQHVSAPGWSGSEEFAPSAFDHQLHPDAARQIRLTLEHEDLGGTRVGYVKSLRKENGALHGTAVVLNTSAGRDALELIREGMTPGLSIGFREVPGQQMMRSDGSILRKKVNIHELAVTEQGAYPQAKIHSLRSAAGNACPHCGKFIPGEVAEDPMTPDAEPAARSRAHPELVLPALRPAWSAHLGLKPPLMVRAKYNADELATMAKKGETFPGSESYPIADRADLSNAVDAVGRGALAGHEAIRKYIIARAKSLGLTSMIPDTWRSDGTLSA